MIGITIICVSYYSRHLLGKVIRNLNDKIEEEKEIIIVNNSMDENLTDMQSIRVTILTPKRNLGYGGGINYGIKYAKYENILIINPDIEVFKFKFNFPQQKSFFIAGGYRPDKPFGFIFPSLFKDTIGFLFPFFKKHTRRRIMCKPNKITKVDWITGSLIATNKTTIKQLNGFDKGFFLFYEEVDLCKRAKKFEIPVFITPDIVYKASSTKEKASSIDVKWLKVRAERDSFLLYHSKHSSKLSMCYVIIKITSCLFVFILRSFYKNQKIHSMIKYYKILCER